MRVTIGQINTTNGDYQGNVASILSAIEQARKDRSDLIVFPEVTIQGYTSLDWFLDPDVIRSSLDPLNKIIEATEGLTAIVGTVRPNDRATGRRLYNSAAIIRDGALLGFADKTLLPEYDVFDDPRYFEPGRERRLFKLDDCDLGVAVCEDFWNDKTFWKQRLYPNDPAQELIEMGAKILVSIKCFSFQQRQDGNALRNGLPSCPYGRAADRLCESHRRKRWRDFRWRQHYLRSSRQDYSASAAVRGIRRDSRPGLRPCGLSLFAG